MNLSGWGGFIKSQSKILRFKDTLSLKTLLKKQQPILARGNGRSYGDSALNERVINLKEHHYFIAFDERTGELHVEAGILLSEILDALVNRGWFLSITPGTKLITIGGAIASDVHGKNHHNAGCFSESIIEFNLMLPNGDIVSCSKTKHSELFHATCGGMGLTGIILDAKISLKKINSQFINQTTVKTDNLKETFEAFEQYQKEPYSVAWIDCLAKNQNLGRSLLMTGDFCDDGNLNYEPQQKFSIPFYFPSFFLNSLTVKIFNFLYYRKVTTKISHQKVSIDSFFYPLDSINHWNKIYGKKGFVQYQFILPKEHSFTGLERILKAISASGKGSFLAVLKLYGPANDNYLSFPIEGYSLALDFKVDDGLFKLLAQLDTIVSEFGGKIYLAKDSCVDQHTFKKGYPKIQLFKTLREKYKMTEKFQSLQSNRLGL